MIKTLFTTLLSSIMVLSLSTNLTANYKNVAKEKSYSNLLNSNHIKIINTNNSGYDWDGVQNSINTDLKKVLLLLILVMIKLIKAFLPLCTIFKFYHINAEKSLSTDFSPHF